jgi:tripartite-type tricarboxylate transporter receptor subunit TctC
MRTNSGRGHETRHTALRSLARSMCIALLWTIFGSMAHGQDYPTKVIQLVVPAAPGGGLDVVARLFARYLQDHVRQTVVVENKAGAQTLIGTKYVAYAPPDGYTILFATSISAFPVFRKDPGVDVAADLSFVSIVMRAPEVIAVASSSPYRSIKDLVTVSTANPGSLNYTTYGQSIWLMSEIVNRAAGIKATNVRFSNAQEAAKAVVNGDADFLLASVSTLRPWLSKGQMRMLAVTSRDRNPNLPDVPSLREVGLEVDDLHIWMGVFVPKGTPPGIVEQLNQQVRGFVQDQASSQRMRDMGFEPYATSPDDFRTFFVREQQTYIEIGKELGIKPE